MERLGSSYILEERIGAGAQGEVWKGHKEGSEEPLAFKKLRPDLARERKVVNTFLKERDTLERVDSPYVVRVRDMVTEGETLGLVMDYVGGGDLADVIREQGALAPGLVASYGAAIAAGLSAIHAAGLVHRDIKPANILMDDASAPPVPRVADFGVARICDSAASTRSTGGSAGTPLYMAPEVADGLPAAPSMDIYSLGVVLYEMLSGHRPFGNGIHEFPWDEDVRLLGISCPDGRQRQVDAINDILKRALMMDPSRRYSEALDMSRELELVGSTDFRVILRPDGPLLNLGSYPVVPPVSDTPPNYGGGSGTGVDPHSHERPGSDDQLNPPHYRPRHNGTTPFPRDPGGNNIVPPPPVYGPPPLDDKYIELINRAIAHRNPHDWGPLVESAAMRHARKTAQEIYQSYPICRFLRLLRRRSWLDSRIVRAVDSAGQFVLTDGEVKSLIKDQNALLAREHIARYDAEVRRQARDDASGTSKRIMSLLPPIGIVILLICIFWSLL